MPSSAQSVTTRRVFDYLVDTTGKAMPNRTVNLVLNFSAASVTAPVVNVGEAQQSTTTDQNGYWSFLVIPNDTLTPSGTLYTLQTPNSTYDVSVPSGGADVQSSTILANAPSVLSPALTGLTGPITVTGNETVTGNLTVQGTTTLAGTTSGALTTTTASIGGDLTIQSAFRLLMLAATSKLVPGATSFSVRNNADSQDNLLVSNAGVATIASDIISTAGRLLLSSAVSKLVPGATSMSLRNHADSADNLILTDAGLATLRNALSIPPSAGGSLAATSYGSVPVKINENLLGVAASSVAFSSIPGVFRHLQAILQVRGDTAAQNFMVNMTLNGDSGANYNYNSLVGNNSAATSAGTGAANNFSVRAPASTASAGQAGMVTIWIANYSGTTFDKNAQLFSNDIEAGGAANFVNQWIAGSWSNTAAITSVTFTASAGNFIAGSLFTLYGVP